MNCTNCCSCNKPTGNSYFIDRTGNGPFCKECWEIWRLWLSRDLTFEQMERKLTRRANEIKKQKL